LRYLFHPRSFKVFSQSYISVIRSARATTRKPLTQNFFALYNTLSQIYCVEAGATAVLISKAKPDARCNLKVVSSSGWSRKGFKMVGHSHRIEAQPIIRPSRGVQNRVTQVKAGDDVS
jgi:hypothetical protein